MVARWPPMTEALTIRGTLSRCLQYRRRSRHDEAKARSGARPLRRGATRLRRDRKDPQNGWLLARDEAAVAAKRERLAPRGPLRGFVGTVSEAIDLIGQYQDAGVQLLINSDYRNDAETNDLLASDVMPHFA